MTFDAIFVPDALRDAVSDAAWLRAMLRCEAALAEAAAGAGAIPAEHGRAIAELCRAGSFDAAELAAAGRAAGNPVEPLVRALRAAVGAEVSASVHHGATSQDVLDSAAMLVAHDALALIVVELDGLAAACAALARAHRTTPVAARTLLQQAVPTTFGAKAAGWLVAVLDAREALDALRTTGLAVQYGGAAGTLAAAGPRALEVLRLYAATLGLPEPSLPWHTARARIARIGSELAIAAGAAAKIGLDVGLLEQTEVGELRQRAGGGSSTMPHKRNPVGSAIAGSCARRATSAASVLLGAMVQEHERALGAWHAEWTALTEALACAGGAAAAVRAQLESVEVDPARMRANLAATGGAISSERVALLLGRDRAGELLERAEHEGRTLLEQVAQDPAAGVTVEDLDPERHLGLATTFVDRALARYEEER